MDHDDPLAPVRGTLIGLAVSVIAFGASLAVYPYLLMAIRYAAAHPYHWPRGWGW